MPFCLIKSEVDKLKKALRDGSIDPTKFADMTSQQRRNAISKFVSETNAKVVNALFESKLLLKNQQRGFITWAKKLVGITPQVRRDLLSRIEKMDKVLDPKQYNQFLQDLASKKLGLDVTETEANNISKLSQTMQKSRDTWQAEIDKNKSWTEDPVKTRKEWINDPKRFKYGADQVALEKYVNDLKLKAKKLSFRETPVKYITDAVKQIPGVMKSAMASLDNSLWGRQGVKTLLNPRTSHVWVRNFMKSWGDMAKGIKGFDAMDVIRADIYSRPNAINGKYKVGRYGLDVLTEEAFPSSIPEKIPLFGRLFKASEMAYSGGALRLRADLADILIARADSQGINTLDKTQAQGIGNLVSSMTGRGSLGKAEAIAKELNVLLFSAKFAKSQFDTLTAHQLDPKATKFSRSVARENLRNMVLTTGLVLSFAKLLDPDSVDEDPRSTNFGKIKVFGRWTDITGGMGSMLRLGARTVIPTKRNGEWGLWSKSSTGKWTNLTAGAYGQQDAWDMVIDGLFSNKLSPVASIARDAWRGEMFGGEPFDITKSITNSLTPLSIQTFNDIKDDKFENVLGSMILEGLGFSFGTYKYKASWEKSTSKEMKQFKSKVGEEKFKQANDDYNRNYNIWYDEVTKTNEYKKLSEDGKSSLITKGRSAIKNRIFKEYGFKYKTEKKTTAEKKETEAVKKLVPK